MFEIFLFKEFFATKDKNITSFLYTCSLATKIIWPTENKVVFTFDSIENDKPLPFKLIPSILIIPLSNLT